MLALDNQHNIYSNLLLRKQPESAKMNALSLLFSSRVLFNEWLIYYVQSYLLGCVQVVKMKIIIE